MDIQVKKYCDLMGIKETNMLISFYNIIEFISFVACNKEVEWLRNLMIEILLVTRPMSLLSIHCDSEEILSKAYCKAYNGKSSHVSLRHSYVKQLLEK